MQLEPVAVAGLLGLGDIAQLLLVGQFLFEDRAAVAIPRFLLVAIDTRKIGRRDFCCDDVLWPETGRS